MEEKLKSYIEMCKDKAKKYGFDLQREIHQVLASHDIILLKKGQTCPDLVKLIDAESLFNNVRSEVINNDIKVESSIYLKLATFLRDVNERTDRRALKIKLNKLYEEASKDDGIIIEIFVNLLNKLPNLQKLSPIGEMELTVNYLDPILSHLFHLPDSNKHLVWLNRQDENTKTCRPDANMVTVPQRSESITLGYIEVKPSDSSDLELSFKDLVRLGVFGNHLMLRKVNRKSMVIQCVGYTVVVYLLTEFSKGITQMTEIFSMEIPKEISELGILLQKVDDLKRLLHIFEHQLETSYKKSRDLEEDPVSIMETINPKRRKQRVPSFSLV